MKTRVGLACWCLVGVTMLAVGTAPARASTFIRLGLEELTAGSNTILLAEVLDAYSYWSPDETFILTDVRVAPIQVLKGQAEGPTFVVTLPGGSVGDLTTLIVGGAALEPGRSYVLFLRDGAFAGAQGLQTVPEHSQGVFEIMKTATGLRAVSQAAEHRVLPDARGIAEPPGGASGLPLDELLERVSELTNHPVGTGRR
jgi:hypothetical protein